MDPTTDLVPSILTVASLFAPVRYRYRLAASGLLCVEQVPLFQHGYSEPISLPYGYDWLLKSNSRCNLYDGVVFHIDLSPHEQISSLEALYSAHQHWLCVLQKQLSWTMDSYNKLLDPWELSPTPGRAADWEQRMVCYPTPHMLMSHEETLCRRIAYTVRRLARQVLFPMLGDQRAFRLAFTRERDSRIGAVLVVPATSRHSVQCNLVWYVRYDPDSCSLGLEWFRAEHLCRIGRFLLS